MAAPLVFCKECCLWLQRALEESKREAAREERRQRRLRREEADRMGQEMDTSSEKIEEAMAIVTAAQTLTEVFMNHCFGFLEVH